ncbi:MAG: ABC transporter permease, partial [Phycisphaerae bacterium]|nr:ABC transporter permease [Phycisphaerae bacterium]
MPDRTYSRSREMNLVANIGYRTVRNVTGFGDFCRFCGQTFAWVLQSAIRRRNLRPLFLQFYHVGTLSVPVVMITGLFVGMVLAVQTAQQFKAIGLLAQMGTV